MLWTFSHARLAPPLSRNRIEDAVTGDLVAEQRFYGTTIPADIAQEQLSRLEPGQWLTADLCSFYCNEVGNAYLEAPGRAKDLVVLHSRTWDLAQWATLPKRIRIPGASQTLENKFVAFPGNDNGAHFFLCIIIFPHDLLYDLNPSGPVRTKAFILNSLHELQPRNPDRKIKDIIKCLAEGRQLREEKLEDINVFLPVVRV